MGWRSKITSWNQRFWSWISWLSFLVLPLTVQPWASCFRSLYLKVLIFQRIVGNSYEELLAMWIVFIQVKDLVIAWHSKCLNYIIKDFMSHLCEVRTASELVLDMLSTSFNLWHKVSYCFEGQQVGKTWLVTNPRDLPISASPMLGLLVCSQAFEYMFFFGFCVDSENPT